MPGRRADPRTAGAARTGHGGPLRRLDRWLLPPLAAALRRLGRGATRVRTLPALPLATVVAVAAVLLSAVLLSGQRPAGDPTVGDVVRVGVSQGQSIPAYLQDSRAELAALAASPTAGQAETYALVTLRAYLAPQRLAAVLAGVSVSHVYARVPLPRTQTEIVRIPAVQVPDDVQALAYRERCSCVYAGVVRATPAVLRDVAARPGVRVVDPAPEVRRVDRAVFLPPLPEQADTVRPPPDGGPPAATRPAVRRRHGRRMATVVRHRPMHPGDQGVR